MATVSLKALLVLTLLISASSAFPIPFCNLGIFNFGCFNLGVGNTGFANMGVGNVGQSNMGVMNLGYKQRGAMNFGAIPRAGVLRFIAVPTFV